MDHNTRRLTTLAAMTLGVAVAAYSLGLFSEARLQPAANPTRVVDLGTIVVTPKDASPPPARYAMSEKHRRASIREQSGTTL